MSNLFMPNKNGRRPNPAPSASSQHGQNFASSSSSSLAPQSSAFGSNLRPRTVSNSNAKPSSSRASLPHASLSASQPLSTISLPLDPVTRARIETLLPQILQLFQLQARNLGTATGSFEMNDLADEEAEGLKKIWDGGSKDISDRCRKEREMLGKHLVDDLGGLLMKLAERVGTELVDRKIEVLRRDLDALRNSSTPSTSNNDHFPAAQNGSALSNALDRIQALEQKLQRSDQERDQLKQTLTSRDQLFEQRLAALENKTVDPRKRVVSTTAGAGSISPVPGGGASNAAEPQNIALADIDKLKKEVEELRESAKRARGAEEEDRQGREKIQKLKELVEVQETKLQQVQGEREVYLQKLQTQSDALDTLSARFSTLHGITEPESSLLRGLSNFLSSSPDSHVESLSSADLSSLLTQRLIELHDTIQSYQSNFEIMGSTVDVHGQQLALLHEKLSNLKPFFEYMSEALPDLQKSLALSKAREADAFENGGAAAEGEGEDELDQMMEESDEERAIERQLVNGTNGSRSSPVEKDRNE